VREICFEPAPVMNNKIRVPETPMRQPVAIPTAKLSTSPPFYPSSPSRLDRAPKSNWFRIG
jgi:hypothetical protein